MRRPRRTTTSVMLAGVCLPAVALASDFTPLMVMLWGAWACGASIFVIPLVAVGWSARRRPFWKAFAWGVAAVLVLMPDLSNGFMYVPAGLALTMEATSPRPSDAVMVGALRDLGIGVVLAAFVAGAYRHSTGPYTSWRDEVDDDDT